MRYTKEQFNNQVIERVMSKYRNGMPITEILKKESISLNELLYIFYLCDLIPDQYLDKLPLSKIEEDKMIVLGDTHIGSTFENIEYLRQVQAFAIDNDIHTILHCGDLIQGCIDQVSKKYSTAELQIERAKRFLSSEDINYYILLGNHDFAALKRHQAFITDLNSRQNINVLGFKKSFVTWQDQIISVHHTIDKYHITIPNIDSLIQFHGHRHNIKLYNNSAVWVPTLSDDVKHYHEQGETEYPGFLLATKTATEVTVKHYDIQENIVDNGIILAKRI